MKLPCPQCGKEVEYLVTNAFRPFCSERCKVIDLGDWADEKFKIPLEHESPSTTNEDDPENE